MGYQVVIPAAGSGRRMGAGRNKLFLKLLEKPLIARTLMVFEDDGDCEGIILSVKIEEEPEFQAIINQEGFTKVSHFVEGGLERQDSVWRGLRRLKGDGVVLIHDGARPFVSLELIHHVVETAERYGAAIPAVPMKDTIKRVSDHAIQETVNRNQLWAAQTPQAFRLPVIAEAHQKAASERYTATDDASLVEWMGRAVRIVQGDYRNIKITTPEDLAIAETFMTKLKGN